VVEVAAPPTDAVSAPGLDVTVTPVRGPSTAVVVGSVHETVAVVPATTAVTPVGGLGAARGVTAVEELDVALVPMALVALTVKV